MGHLILTRREGERVLLGEDIVIEVNRIKGGQVRLSITAPNNVHILREELSGDPAPHKFEPSNKNPQVCRCGRYGSNKGIHPDEAAA